MSNRRSLALALTLGLGVAGTAGAQSTGTIGMGGAGIAMPDPLLTGRENPAFLGVVSGRGFRMHLIDFGLEVGNSSFSLADYTEYNGKALTEQDEDDILAKMGDEGLQLAAAAEAGPTFAMGPVAVGARGVGYGGGSIPREVLELVFDGNTVGETVDFTNASGGGWAAAEFHAAYGRAIPVDAIGGETTVGVRGRYLQGLAYASVIEASGQIVTEIDSLYGGVRWRCSRPPVDRATRSTWAWPTIAARGTSASGSRAPWPG